MNREGRKERKEIRSKTKAKHLYDDSNKVAWPHSYLLLWPSEKPTMEFVAGPNNGQQSSQKQEIEYAPRPCLTPAPKLKRLETVWRPRLLWGPGAVFLEILRQATI